MREGIEVVRHETVGLCSSGQGEYESAAGAIKVRGRGQGWRLPRLLCTLRVTYGKKPRAEG